MMLSMAVNSLVIVQQLVVGNAPAKTLSCTNIHQRLHIVSVPRTTIQVGTKTVLGTNLRRKFVKVRQGAAYHMVKQGGLRRLVGLRNRWIFCFWFEIQTNNVYYRHTDRDPPWTTSRNTQSVSITLTHHGPWLFRTVLRLLHILFFLLKRVRRTYSIWQH